MSNKISIFRSFFYGGIAILTTSSLIVSAGTEDGVFGEYFMRMVGMCSSESILTGLSDGTSDYGTHRCTTLKSILASVFGSQSAPSGSFVTGFDADGNLLYTATDWKKNGTILSYTGTKVGIGTDAPQDLLDINGNTIIRGTLSVSGIVLSGVTINLPPVCLGADKALQFDGINWKCATISSIVYSDPTSVFTDVSISTIKTAYSLGDILYGYIDGGDPKNTWACMDIPSGSQCTDRNNWRQLTKPYFDPISGTVIQDDWQFNAATNRIELRGGFNVAYSFPTGIYKGYVATGKNGTASVVSFTVSDNPPKALFTDISVSTIKTTYALGETLYGYVDGGDPTNTWACLDIPSGSDCADRSKWRQLTKPYFDPISGTVIQDDWQYNSTTKRIELRGGINISYGYPTGTYKGYAANGQYGVAGMVNFTVNSTDPRTITTDVSISNLKTAYSLGDILYGYIDGGDPTNTWACMDIPGGSQCSDRSKWRQLTKPYSDPISGTVIQDDWQYNSTTKRIELRGGFKIESYYPTGTYNGYAATGQYGLATLASFQVSAPASACSWQYGFIAGPTWPSTPTISPSTCTTATNGTVARENAGTFREIATCQCN